MEEKVTLEIIDKVVDKFARALFEPKAAATW
jgi:hypothetical protein